METSQLLSIESFSFKWVINLKLEGYLDEFFRASLEAADEMRIPFIDMDPKKAVSRSSSFSMKDFNFSTSQQSQHPSILVHADEVFSNGLLMPFFLNPSKEVNLDASNSSQKQVTTSSSESSNYVFSTNQNHGWLFRIILKSWRRIVKKHLHKSWRRSTSVKKHLGWLKRAYSHSNSSTRADTISSCMEDKEWEETSARTSTAYLIHDCYDIEKSIQDAVLHCKRSYGSL
ncbi:hypothetical protein FRX31_003968 [Thalictrum thalictroides]|uniref:Membrane-associated kinase regulator 6 n=1 Tax=Thalictrum thalictroides TaxID=46969 RepID=A0A7J6XBW0_THATH|nr:hypothetical protein FRX31_003968 [Thalictrum thalictroides]